MFYLYSSIFFPFKEAIFTCSHQDYSIGRLLAESAIYPHISIYKWLIKIGYVVYPEPHKHSGFEHLPAHSTIEL